MAGGSPTDPGEPSGDLWVAPAEAYQVPGVRRWRTGARARAGVGRYAGHDRDAGAALDQPRAVERAVRLLRRRVDSRTAEVLDEEATAEATCEAGFWAPVLVPARERWLTVSLVVESGGAMALWSSTAEQFATVLAGSGAFRDVRVHDWAEGDRGPVLPSRDGRHLVLVLSDTHGPRWADGSAHRQLAAWAADAPVAVLNVLPEHLWTRLPVLPSRARLRSPGPAAPNSRWTWEEDDVLAAFRGASPVGAGCPDGPSAIPVPVLELDAEALTGWARFTATERPAEYVARVLSVSAACGPVLPAAEGQGQRGDAPGRPMAAGDRVRRMRAQLSPTAYHLARLYAATPLNLTMLQVIRAELLPEARTWHLAELLISGLLLPAEEPAEPEPVPAAARIEWEFEDGVRQELLAEGTRRETGRALRVAFDHLGRIVPGSAGQSLRLVSSLVADPGQAARLSIAERARHWLHPAISAFSALDGAEYTTASAELVRQSAETSAANDASHTESDNFGAPALPFAFDGETGDADALGDGGNVSVSGVQPASAKAQDEGLRKPPPVWGNVPPRNRAFTGRGQLLENLHARLQEGTTAVLPEALQGMGGVGKSQLAVEYVYRHMHEYNVVWWIPAEQPQQIRQVLVDLARRLDLDIGGGEANTAVPAVIEALRVGRPHSNWLLVFDNAENPETVREFFPTNGPGRILVTSRNAQWATAARPLEVDVFTREESRQLLQLRAPDLDDATADRLAETLGDLPLGVEQAAVWLAETGMPADEYLRLFEQQAAELMLSDPPPDYPLSVAAAWNVSLERLAKNHPAALQLLQVCAFFAPEPISRKLLTGVRDAPVPPELAAALNDPIRLGRAIREINRYALARISHSTNTIQLHRLVQRVLINQMPESLKTQMRNGAHRLLANGDPGEPTASHQWQRYGDLLPHVLNSRAVDSADPWVRQLVLNEIQYMYSWGDHEGSRDLAERTYRSWQRDLGKNDEHTLAAAQLYANTLRILGQYRDAFELDRRTQQVMREALGEEHESTLEVTSTIAWDLRLRGDFTMALQIDREILETHRRLFGLNDLSTLNVAHRMALSLRLIGNFDEALELDQDTYRRKVEELGEDTLSTLSTLAAVALDLQEAGNYIAARDQQREVSNRYEYTFGPTNFNTMASYKGLAVTERRAGRHEVALELSAKALTLFRTRYGDNYPNTLAALLAHAVDVRHSGDLHRALELSEQGVKGYQRLFGADHPHALAAQVNHAVCLRMLGRTDSARQLNEQLQGMLKERLGADHPNTLVCGSNLAADYYELGEAQRSVDTSKRSLEQCRARLGDDHPASLATALNLTLGLRMTGGGTEADTLYEDTLARYERILGPDHPGTVAAAGGSPANCDIDPMPL
ncbi:FxSxx-COOH system tetratricopeptide repeat protein [Streptomyces sparsus]